MCAEQLPYHSVDGLPQCAVVGTKAHFTVTNRV